MPLDVYACQILNDRSGLTGDDQLKNLRCVCLAAVNIGRLKGIVGQLGCTTWSAVHTDF